MALSWRHHTLIQALLCRGPLIEDQFRSIFAGVSGERLSSNRRLFNDYLLKINKELAFAQFELRACRNQYDGNVYYGMVNNVADEQSKLGTQYTVPQITFYKGIIEAIIQDATAQGSISNIDALNVRLESQAGPSQVPTAVKTFSFSQKEKTLEELVRDQWLCSTVDGNIGLGPRSFLDLRSWFHNNDIPTCEVCSEALVKAESCPNESCNVRIHKYCLSMKFSQRKVEKVCSSCKTPWPCEVNTLEAVKAEEDDHLNEPSQNNVPPLTRKRRMSSRATDPDQVGSSSSPISGGNEVVRRVTRKTSRLK
ncbi:non-structural maintenance of chromosomes element 1 homolog [Impatiens glandulifera]|uniref:non-structural maintenance of chromosomes element 1 homolog n=1 Tax=Impatiens glandulifera TaxID=253017 RepID=UPI001FB10015|nr:non-structural maintenance of chromosomes element 1 homolog [Impatiens glandulifera]